MSDNGQLLDLDDAIAVVDELGFVIADPGLFASAIGRPAQTVFGMDAYPDLPTKVAALLHSVATNHALADGNERTAWTLARVTYLYNGVPLIADEDEAVGLMLDVATGRIDLDAIAKWLADHSGPANPR